MAAINQTRPAGTASIRAPLFILGVALALIAFIVMFAFGLLFANRASTSTTVQVVVATQHIDARAPIDPLSIKLTSVPSSVVPSNAIKQLSALAHSYAVVDIEAGQVISPNIVSTKQDDLTGTSSYLLIPKGWTALTLPTSELTGVAGFIARGDYIEVIATVNTNLFNRVNPRQVTRTVFTGVHVIEVGPASAASNQPHAQGVVASITVVMPLCDAQFMKWLLANAVISYALMNYQDYPSSAPVPSPSCPDPTVAPPAVGPHAVDLRWDFTAAA